jgi:MFS family permease
MPVRQLIALFVCNVLFYTVGNALTALMPLYTRQLGADASVTGFYFAFCFAVLAVSTLSSGWLSNRFQRRRGLLVLTAALSAPAVLGMGFAQDMIQLTLANAILWFLFGIGTMMISILAGMYAPQHQRGRMFGIIAAGIACGQVLSGSFSGYIIDQWGFLALFATAALIFVAAVPVALMALDHPVSQTGKVSASPAAPMSLPIKLLLAAGVLAYIAHFMVNMARPLAMDAQAFNLTTITAVMAVGSLFNLPMPFVMGWLSDRIGRKVTLLLCYGLAAAGTALLIPAVEIWHFAAAQVMLTVVSSGQSISAALVTDLSEPQSLSRNLSRFGATAWIGAVLGYMSTGLAIANLGLEATLVGATAAAAVSVLLVNMIDTRSKKDAYSASSLPSVTMHSRA